MKKFNQFTNESIRDKMTPVSHGDLGEIMKLLQENGYTNRGINIDDEGEYYKKERNNDIMWFIYGDDTYVKGKEIEPNVHYLSITKKSKLSEVKDRINLYKKRYKL